MKNSENLKNAVETQKKLDLLANLLSSEDDNTKVPFKKSFNELVEFLENEFIPNLEKSQFSETQSIIQRINSVIHHIELFNEVPSLLGKRIIGLIDLDEKEALNLLITLFGEKNGREISKCRNIPTIVIPSSKDNVIINDEGKNISVSDADLEVVNTQLWRYDLDIRQFLKAEVISINSSLDNIVFIYIPPFSNSGRCNITKELFTLLDIKVYIAKEMSSIDKRYQTIFKFANSIKRQTVIVTSKQNIDINLSDDANIMSCQDFKNNLIKDNHIVHNELFSSEIDYIIDDIALYYSTLKKELSYSKKLISANLTKMQEDKSKDLIENLFVNNDKESKRVAQEEINFSKLIIQLSEKCKNHEKILSGFISNSEDVTQKHFPYKYYTTIERLFLRSIDKNELEQALKYYNILKSCSYKNLYICDLLLENEKASEMPKVYLNNLKLNTEKSEFIIRAKVRLNKYIDFSVENFLELNFKLNSYNSILNNYELFYFAQSLLKSHRELAIDLLLKASKNGMKEATNYLLNISKDNKHFLEILGHEMVPEANFALAKSKKDDWFLSSVFYKLAASKDHYESIELLVSRQVYAMFKKLKKSSNNPEPVKTDEDLVKAKNCIALYNHLLEKKKDPMTYEMLGRLYEFIGDYIRSSESFIKSNTAVSNYKCGLMYMYHDAHLGQDLEKARDFLKKANDLGYKDAKIKLDKVENWIKTNAEQKKARETRSYSRRYSSSGYYSSSSSSLSFICSAACVALSKSLECDELEVLKKFREQEKRTNLYAVQLLKEYNIVGPKIVDLINNSPNKINIYQWIWTDYIVKTYLLVKESRYDEAVDLYVNLVVKLCNEFKVTPSSKVINLIKNHNITIGRSDV